MKILFVCQANVGRSQAAMELYRQKGGEADSVGTKVDAPGTTLAVRKGAPTIIGIMKQDYGIDMTNNIRTQISQDNVDGYDRIIVMAQRDTVPQWLFDDKRAEFWTVQDTKGQDTATTRKIVQQIKRKVDVLFDTPTSRKPIVSIQHFGMDFGGKTVIKDLSFDVHKGEVFGFLGSNGSGKTTTIRALLGIYTPTSGELLVGGRPFSVSSGIKLGYLPEERGLYKKETVLDVMVYFGQLKGLTKDEAKARAEAYLARVKLSDKATTRIDKLSGGQQQKVQLGITIMNSPELLILDEPTKGFDPVNRRLLMDIIEEHQRGGATVIFVTHQMEEVERLCDRIVLLKDGKAQAYGTIADVKKKFGGKSLDDIFLEVYGDENEQSGENSNV